MRSTGPTLRRRQWRQRLRARHEDEDHANDADGEDHADHSEDSGSEDEDEAKPRFFRPAVQPNTAVSTGPNLGTGAGVTVGPNPGSGLGVPTGPPESTLAAGEGDVEAEDEEDEEEEEKEGEGEEEESESDSDDEPSDGDESSSDDDSDEEEATVPPPGPPSTTTGLAAIAPPGATGTIASGGTASPTAGTPPALAPIGGIMSQVQPTTSTTRQETTQTTASPSTTASISETTSVSQPGLGEVDRIVTGTAEPTTLADAAPVLSDGSGGGMETGAAAGIIVGTLAFVGILLIGGWFLYKKMRRDPDSDSDSDSDSSSPLPKFSPPKFFNFRSSVDRSTYSWKFWDTNSSSGTRTTVAPAPAPVLAPPQLPFANKKTNSEMIDQLMQAAYAAESGGNYNDLESRAGYWDEKSQAGAPVPHPTQVNETTYKALFGNGPNSPMPPTAPAMPFVGKPSNQGRPLTNGGNPMMRWLDATATPRQSEFGPPPSNAGLRPDQDR